MKHFDKENIIVIGVALLLLIAWGFWYPQRQAKLNKQAKERSMAAAALADKKQNANANATPLITRNQSFPYVVSSRYFRIKNTSALSYAKVFSF